MGRAFLALGSNLGDRLGYLRLGIDGLRSQADIEVVAVSPVYETDPVGGPEQSAFLNLVVELSTERTARELLKECWRLEFEAERVRVERWGPRTLDVDVLWLDDETVDDPPDLIVPHPRMRDRAFVMVPLGDLAPDLVEGWEDPGTGEVRVFGEL